MIYAQDRSVEGFLKEKNQSLIKVKLYENKQKEIILVLADSSRIMDLDSIIKKNNFSNFTMNDSIKKKSETIQQLLILENGNLSVQYVEMDLKIKKYENGFSLKIDTGENKMMGLEGTSNTQTLEISSYWWCKGGTVFADTKEECQKKCSGECYKRAF